MFVRLSVLLLRRVTFTGWDSLSECIVKLFNHILSTETVPVKWATGYVVPLHKGGSITHTNNYRGISLTSSLGKLFSSVLSNRLYQEIESKDLPSKHITLS